MPDLYGFYISKDVPDALGRKNGFYCMRNSLSEALATAQNIFDFERMIHTSVVSFTNIHAWKVGSGRTVFDNIPVDDPGMVTQSGTYNGPKEVVTLEFGSDIGYGGYKDYRLALGHNNTDGQFLTGGMEDIINEAITEYLSVFLTLCTRKQNAFTSVQLISKLDYRNLSKRWYDRAA